MTHEPHWKQLQESWAQHNFPTEECLRQMTNLCDQLEWNVRDCVNVLSRLLADIDADYRVKKGDYYHARTDARDLLKDLEWAAPRRDK